MRFRVVTLPSHLESIRKPSTIDTDGNGRVDKSAVLQALQQKGESYDKARETLKHVGVDASGKVELEDWVEVGVLCQSIFMGFGIDKLFSSTQN